MTITILEVDVQCGLVVLSGGGYREGRLLKILKGNREREQREGAERESRDRKRGRGQKERVERNCLSFKSLSVAALSVSDLILVV
jgi:hypothetical protein